MDEEELQEADVLWPWPDTPPPSPEEESYLPPPALPEYDDAAVEFSCEPFSAPPPASSCSSLTTTSSAQWSEDLSSSDGSFFLSGGPSPAGSAGVGGLDAAEEFLEADVLWPETPGDEAAGFWWRRCCRRVEVEEAASAAASADAAACGEREGWRPLVSSPIDIPVAARGAARRRPSPLPAVLAARRRW